MESFCLKLARGSIRRSEVNDVLVKTSVESSPKSAKWREGQTDFFDLDNTNKLLYITKFIKYHHDMEDNRLIPLDNATSTDNIIEYNFQDGHGTKHI